MNKKILACFVPALLLGCAPLEQVKQDVVADIQVAQKGPDAAPQKNHTNMQDSLRCMDKLFLENGIRDLVVMTEDIVDNSKKLQVGARDMLISSVSDMTRRSRAVRLITFGGDVVNLVNWLNASGSNSRVYTFKPDFNIRGSISQMDDNLAQRRSGAGASVGPIDFDKSKDASAAVLGLDLSIISTQTMELLPGVTSRNSIVLVKEGSGTGGGVSGTVAKQRFGVNFDFSFNKNEGSAQAVRTLVELATIELLGKLTRVPYWSCLGIDEEHPVVKEEIGDWYFVLANDGKLIPYVQNQLRIRGVYRGPVDGSLNPEFVAVMPQARKALGLPQQGDIDEPFFAGLVNLKSRTLGVPGRAVAHLTLAQLDSKAIAARAGKPLGSTGNKRTRSINDSVNHGAVDAPPVTTNEIRGKPKSVAIVSKSVKPGESIPLSLKSAEPSFAYCFYQEAPDQWMRIFPSRFVSDPLLQKGQTVDITGEQKLQIKAGPKDQKEVLACFNTHEDVTMNMAPEIRGGDFELNPGLTLGRLRTEFEQLTVNSYAEAFYEIRKR